MSQSESRAEANRELEDADVMKLGVSLELGLVAASLLLAWLFGFFERTQPLGAISQQTWSTGVKWGLLGTIPMLAYMGVYIYRTPRFLLPMRDFVDTQLRPLFRKRAVWELVVLSLLAGFCEELFFRWCLQGGIASLTSSVVAGLLLASAFFGLAHWVNASYGISTAVIGIYLGCLMIWSGTWLAPAIAHTLFDFIAFLYIKYSPVNKLAKPS